MDPFQFVSRVPLKAGVVSSYRALMVEAGVVQTATIHSMLEAQRFRDQDTSPRPRGTDMSTRSQRKDQVFMNIAEELSGLSTCERTFVGAIIVLEGRCVSWGFNGAPPGMPHCDENDHGWDGLLKAHPDQGCRNSIHAEANALAFAARQGISTAGATLYVTTAPCLDCANLLIAAGIKRVVYNTDYRHSAGLERLRGAGIQIG